MNEIYSKPPKKNFATNKTDVFFVDKIWSFDILNLKDYGPENNREYRHVLVLIDNFPKYGWTVPLKNNGAQTIINCFEKFLISSKISPKLLERDRDRGFYNKISRDFLNIDNIKFILEILL